MCVTALEFHLVPPEVEVTASHLQVNLGGSISLFCNVTRTNPDVDGTYVWINERTKQQISESSETLSLTLSTLEDFGTYTCMVTNTADATGSGSVTIEQGCKLNLTYTVLLVT